MELQVEQFFDTFNIVTVSSAITAGFTLGFFAFMPLIQLMFPPNENRIEDPRQAFMVTFFSLFILLGTIFFTFYAAQVMGELLINGQFFMRAVGRFASSMTFILAFSLGVGMTVYRQTKAQRKR